jgi:methylenetetrahydrofolate dehydrogenase (NADP+)/methenyltetrahydrofolate cyclohydrolase
MQIINGKYYADQILADIKLEVSNLAAQNIYPSLAIVLVGENQASKIYVTNKMKRAHEVGIKARLVHLPSETSQDMLLKEINQLNDDKTIDGIIVQLPLPDHIDKHIIQQSIAPAKDVDGFHPVNVGMLHSEITDGLISCTPQGCMHLIKTVCPDLTGKLAIVIGRSSIVGKPMGALLLQANATVIMAHSKTQNLHELTNKADIVVSATGQPLFLKKHHFKKGAIVIDVGSSRVGDKSNVGDVDFEDVKDMGLGAISPVPGGVGPMTIAYLLANVVKAAKRV